MREKKNVFQEKKVYTFGCVETNPDSRAHGNKEMQVALPIQYHFNLTQSQ